MSAERKPGYEPQRARHRLRTGNEGWLTSYADLVTNLLIFFALIVSASEIQTGRMERIVHRMQGTESTGSLSDAQKIVEQTIQQQHLAEQVEVKMTDAGLELSFNSGLAFDSGRAEIRPEMVAPLSQVLTPLIQLASQYHFAVEGHTDTIPIGTGSPYKSNWELSSARALAVRERLEALGVPRDRIRVEAYADTRPLPPEALKNLSAEQVLARHRRVVVRLY